ncbi:MAG: tRNA (adenosine(37)-N6)-dimethylallyltransferase MiaA [Simkania sp.]|nr:tRNA (adenosine(37)-N6)-dimethylallyltransferase MiaA [Simkania sp.]
MNSPFFCEENDSGALGVIPAPLKKRLGEAKRKKKVLVIAGPTAVGKTAVSLRLAEMLGGQIISADSMQVYRGMDIGTAKVSLEERARIPHYLIDIRNINESFNVAQFCNEAHRALRLILQEGAAPLVVGGTGFYIRAFIYGPPSGPPSVPGVRQKIEMELDQLGPVALYDKLKTLDPDYASRITAFDRHKIVRGLEIISITGLKVTEFTACSPEQTEEYDFRCWFLYKPLEVLYKTIEERCDTMIEKGLLSEIKGLIAKGLRGNTSAIQAIGYRQCVEFLDSAQTPEDWALCLREFKKASRHYARRQFTWFRREPLFRWLDMSTRSIEDAAEMIAQDFEVN